MTDLTIRRATAADALPLSELAARTYVDTFGDSTAPDDLAAYLAEAYGVAQQTAEIASPDEVTLLASLGDELVGYAQVRRGVAPSCVAEERAIEIHRFYLVRAVHGRGFAVELMRAARAAARDFGALHVWLGVWEHNTRAFAFYTKQGFRRVGSHDFVVGTDRQTDWVLVGPAEW